MRRLGMVAGGALLLGLSGVVAVWAQDATLGGTTAAGAGSATLDAGSGVNGSAALGSARGAGNPRGGDTGSDDPRGGGSASGSSNARGGGGSGEGGAAAGVAVRSAGEPVLYGGETGDALLNELTRGGTRRTVRTRRTRRGRRLPIMEAPRLQGRRARARSRAVARRYQIPPRGILSFYLPEDRYKITSGIWKFVSIEDDANRFPVRYYYRPGAANFLRSLSVPARGAQNIGGRPARVIGFNTWQEAMRAGYRPDPVSRPEPGAQLAYLAGIGRGPQLSRYAGFVYAGQVSPAAFTATVNYVHTVERIVVARRDTRPLLNQTVGQVLAAALGEGPLPTRVGQTVTVTTTTTTDSTPGSFPSPDTSSGASGRGGSGGGSGSGSGGSSSSSGSGERR